METTADDAVKLQEVNKKLMSNMDSLEAEMQQLAEEYNASYDAAYKNITGSMGLFEKMDVKVELSVSDMIGALKSQATYMDEYAANLKRAAERGVDEGLIAELSDGSTESAAILQEIVDSSGAEINELNVRFKRVEEGKQNFSSEIAKMQTDFDGRMQKIKSSYDKMVEGVDQYSQAVKNAGHTVDGIVNTLQSRLNSLYNMGVRMGNQVNAGYRAALDIRSPSRKMQENAEFTAQPIITGLQQNLPKVREAAATLGSAAGDGYKEAAIKAQQSYLRMAETAARLVVQPQTVTNAPVTNKTTSTVMNYYQMPKAVSYAELARMKRQERQELIKALKG